MDGHVISFVIPTLDEEDVIGPLIRDIFRHVAGEVEIVVVDDSPGPATAAAIEALADSRVRVVRRGRPRGLAAAIVRGVIEARGDVIGWMDADAWMLPERLPDMIAALDGADMAIASRYVPGGGDDRTPLRILASRAINGFARLMLAGQVRDYSSCFTVMRRSVLDSVVPDSHGFGEFFVEFVHEVQRAGLRIVEVPYVLRDRTHGESKASPNLRRFIRLGMNYLRRIVVCRLRAIRLL